MDYGPWIFSISIPPVMFFASYGAVGFALVLFDVFLLVPGDNTVCGCGSLIFPYFFLLAGKVAGFFFGELATSYSLFDALMLFAGAGLGGYAAGRKYQDQQCG
jgi:hypothetical protein